MIKFARGTVAHRASFDRVSRLIGRHGGDVARTFSERRHVVAEICRLDLPRFPLDLAPAVTDALRDVPKSQRHAAKWAVAYHLLRESWRDHSQRCSACKSLASEFPFLLIRGTTIHVDPDPVVKLPGPVHWHSILRIIGVLPEDEGQFRKAFVMLDDADADTDDQAEGSDHETEGDGREERMAGIGETGEDFPSVDEGGEEVDGPIVLPECPFCLQGIQDPVLLGCPGEQHAICKACVQSVIDAQAMLVPAGAKKRPSAFRIRCPTCSHVTAVPAKGGVKGLKVPVRQEPPSLRRLRHGAAEIAEKWQHVEEQAVNAASALGDAASAAAAKRKSEQQQLERAFVSIETAALLALKERKAALLKCAKDSIESIIRSLEAEVAGARLAVNRISTSISRSRVVATVTNLDDAKQLEEAIMDGFAGVGKKFTDGTAQVPEIQFTSDATAAAAAMTCIISSFGCVKRT